MKKLDLKYHFSTSLTLDAVPLELSRQSKLYRSMVIGKDSRASRTYIRMKLLKIF